MKVVIGTMLQNSLDPWLASLLDYAGTQAFRSFMPNLAMYYNFWMRS